MQNSGDNINSYNLFKKLKINSVYDNISRPVIIADNIRTPENMGMILRIAGNIGAEKVFFINDNPGKEVRGWKIKKTASGAESKISWEIIPKKELFKKLPRDYELVAVETSEKADNIYFTKLPVKIALIVGNEVYGITNDLLKTANKTVYIPVPGVISSLNVTHALAIAVFEWYRQMINT